VRRLTEQQKSLIIKLASNGFSLNSIVKETKLPKSVVYYWFRKSVGKKIKTIKIHDNFEEEIGEIAGTFAGDGNFYLDSNYSYRIRFYFSRGEIEYANRLNNLLEKVYERCGNILPYKSVLIVDIHGKTIIEHIKKFLEWEGKKTYSVRLKHNPFEYSLNFLKGFCRGLIKAEGWILKNNLMVSCVSKSLIDNLSDSLDLLKIPHLKTVWKSKDNRKVRHAIFFNKKNTLTFFNRVGL
jgi:hypothetical protein